MKISYFKLSFKQGIIMGLSFCTYTTIMWLTKLDTKYLRFGQYLDMAIIILPIIMIFLAIRKANNSHQITISQRIVIAISVAIISYLIYAPFLYMYHHYINPEWFTAVMNLKETELKMANVSQQEILATLEKMEYSSIAQSPFIRLSSLIPSTIIIPTLIALTSLIFIKKPLKK